MCRFVVILMTLSIAFSPVLAGPIAACAPHECACRHVTGLHASPSTGTAPEGCGCFPATQGHCCRAEKNVPEQPLDLLPPERMSAADPTHDSGGSATVDMRAADGPHSPAYISLHQWRAPPPLTYLLHQSFLI